ncbi:MAG TPA: hypothetical protein VGM07_10130 [Stellaceae bacterium]|jgi:hypothetical protein
MPSIPLVLAAAMALAPLGAGQQARLAAWLEWAAAYRDCYAPAPFSLRIDQPFTSRCVERAMRRQVYWGPPEQRAATAALIAATPGLVAMLNAPVGRTSTGAARGLDAPPPRWPASPDSGNSTASRRQR